MQNGRLRENGAETGAVGERAVRAGSAGPIDHVYTWVNAADEALSRRRAAYAATEVKTDHAYVAGPARYADHGELRLAIDNARRMLPFVRTTYIFGAGQAPDWLSQCGDAVRYVEQNSVIPEADGPFFHSDAVESYIHRIPGLAEHYIYSNDDCFFARRHTPSDFFDASGRAQVGLGAWMVGDDASPTFRRIGENTVRAIQRQLKPPPFDMGYRGVSLARHELRGRVQYALAGARLRARGLRPLNAISHVSQPFRRSAWEGFERRFAGELGRVRARRFRSADGVAVNLLHHYYAGSIGAARLHLSDDRLLLRSQPSREREKLLEDLRSPASSVARFCLNDTPVDREDGWEDYVAQLLRSLLPTGAPDAGSRERTAGVASAAG